MSTPHFTLAQAWEDYRVIVIPTARPKEAKARKVAFYAGAEAVFARIKGLDPRNDPTAEFVADLHEELLAFAKDVQEGVA